MRRTKASSEPEDSRSHRGFAEIDLILVRQKARGEPHAGTDNRAFHNR